MKLKGDKKTTTLTMGDVDAKSFGIDTSNGVIFDILRNKMYSNKIAAVAREITSNSRDANRENKKTDTPIEVHIVEPNIIISSTDMQIVFKDYGTGITPDRMENIFLNYGASTKRNTNKQTGGFGLGAKTPFAYTDTFTVITVYKGDKGNVKDTYTASITDRKGVGSGEMILFDSQPTKEETGTCIVVPIRESDRYEFEKEVRRATAFWKVKPKLKGFTTDEWKFKEVFKGTGFAVIEDKKGYFSNRYLLVIDGIPYEVDRSVLGLSSDFLYNTNLVLCYHYNNGDLTVSANREAVQYDRKTKITIQWRIRQIKRVFCKEVQTLFDKCTTYLETCILANEMTGEAINEKTALWRHVYKHMMPNNFKPTFQGKKVVQAAAFKWHELTRYDGYEGKKLNGIRMNVRTYDEKWLTPMYLLDCTKRDTRKNATLIDQGGFILISVNEILKKEGKDAAQQTEYDKIYKQHLDDQAAEYAAIQALGMQIGMYSTVIKKVMPKGQSTSEYYKKTNEVGVQVRNVGHYNYSEWESNTITFLRKEKTTASGLQYIYCATDKLSHFQSYSANSPEMPSNEQLAKGRLAAKVLGLQFVIVPEASLTYFTDALMTTIDQAWDKVLALPTTEAQIIEALNYDIVADLHLTDKWKGLELKGRISAEAEGIVALYFQQKGKRFSSNKFMDDNDTKQLKGYAATITVKGISKELEELKKKYPLMKCYFDGYSSYGSVKEMNEVMDAFDTVGRMSQTTRKANIKAKLAVRKQMSKFNKRNKS